MMSPKLCVALATATVLSACGGVPQSNELRLDNDGGGALSGTAGRDWTPAEIIAQACGPNTPATDFRTIGSTSDGGFAFGGQCATGQTALVAPTNASAPQTTIAPPAAQTSGDRSTYVSPFATGYQPPEGFYDN